MTAASTASLTPVDRFFEFSLLGLLASGFLAVVGSGYLDTPTMLITAAAFIVRAFISAGVLRFELPSAVVTAITLLYIGFYPIDYFFISRAFIPAAVHLVFFVAVVKIVTGRTDRDYLFLKVIAFLELLAACVLSTRLNFFVFLLLFLVLGVATFASDEIRHPGGGRHSLARISGRDCRCAWFRWSCLRFSRHPDDHRRTVLLSAAHGPRRVPTPGLAPLPHGRFFQSHDARERSARSRERTRR